jgi:hypothetical protein
MNHADRHLTDQLRNAAHDMPETHIDLEALQQGGHRSTWRPVLLAVAAAIAAIAVPAGAILLVNQARTQTPPATASSTGGPASAPTTAPSAKTSTVPALPSAPSRGDVPLPTLRTPTARSEVTLSAFAKLPSGVAPGLPYYSDGAFHPAGNGPSVPINLGRREAVRSFARYSDGWVAQVVTFKGTLDTRIYDSAGNQVSSSATNGDGIGRGADGSTAVSFTSGQLSLVSSRGTVVQTWTLPDSYSWRPVSVLPDHSVIAVAGYGDGSETVRALPDGSLEGITHWNVDDANQVSSDVIVGGPDCTGVFSIEPFQPQWSACPYMSGAFSPQGNFMVTADMHQGGLGPNNELSILNAKTGAIIVRFVDPPSKQFSWMNGYTWEDNKHVLVMAWSQGARKWYALRFGVDGTVERVDTVPLRPRNPGLNTPIFEVPL